MKTNILCRNRVTQVKYDRVSVFFWGSGLHNVNRHYITQNTRPPPAQTHTLSSGCCARPLPLPDLYHLLSSQDKCCPKWSYFWSRSCHVHHQETPTTVYITTVKPDTNTTSLESPPVRNTWNSV